MKRTGLLLLVMALVALGAGQARGAYAIKEISNPYGAYDIRSWAVNDGGLAVGYMKNASNYEQPFVYDAGSDTLTELPRYSGAYKATAYAVNNASLPQVIGYMPTRVGNPLLMLAENSSNLSDSELAFMAPYLATAVGLAIPEES